MRGEEKLATHFSALTSHLWFPYLRPLMFKHFRPFFKSRAVWATGLVFVVAGYLMGSWTVLIPYVKAKFELEEAALGLLLLCLPAGAVLTNPFTVPMLRRFGLIHSTIGTLMAAATMFVLPIVLPSVWLVALALFLTGAGYTCINIAMNTCASELERTKGIRIIGTCHGLWSLGAMLGSALCGMITGAGMHPIHYVLVVLVFCGMFSVAIFRPLTTVPEPIHDDAPKQRLFIWPNAMLWVLITIGLLVSLAEGSMVDWSGVYMRETLQVSETQVGWGFAAYAFFMASGRFLGDGLIDRFGGKNLLLFCGILAATGLLILASVPGLAGALTGFVLTGAGVSVGAPILYAESARVPDMPPGAGLATYNTFAMVGFLGGPAFIGFLAEAFSLPTALGVVGVGAVVWAAVSRRM